ncbi:helix-turn-helix domain-containing protein [Blautia massiliensis (ex Durand et al. 2017)]|uniref:helix-turn-helix domain-containing protein n=1 Tax=Blautia TaxID=572511 RepID=UPI0003977A6B|nr:MULTISPECIES: helix-turn-helix transcriptional regulator [Blautia]ERI97876.1 DNA-binding helix-turn-helix protein [Blautia sp. KLE 1732]UEA29146.1 helix-turn-helix domain-containing protein [Blautia massiliensis (ex Durand et al. 2017)]UWO17540.1 helix-turn-helix domain-containing protein [Blautia sp. KLE_1732_HM_1032]
MGNRLQLLRKTRNLTQEVVSSELGISQQTLSRCETDITTLQIDLLYKISQYYNVSTDYVLGLSDSKWTTEQSVMLNQCISKYQEFFDAFETLDEYDKELIRGLIAQMKKLKNRKNNNIG